ncbi:MAG: hypothetical protein AAF420_06835 [Pseudomonadota bacterium]
MCPKRLGVLPRKQRGVSLIAAIVVLVMLSSMAAFIATITVFHHAGSGLSLQNSRALAAASSGIEWGVWHVRSTDNCPANNAAATFTVGQFTVAQNSCSEQVIVEGANSYKVFEIEYTASSTGLSFGDPSFAARTLRATVVGI